MTDAELDEIAEHLSRSADGSLIVGPVVWRGHAERLLAEVRLLRDDPDADFTDLAHPAWWRGHDAAVAVVVEKLTDVLDGRDDGGGVASGEYEVLRRRLLALASPGAPGGRGEGR